MMESMVPKRLEMRWLPVIDAAGRTRMEASWVPVSAGYVAEQATTTHAA